MSAGLSDFATRGLLDPDGAQAYLAAWKSRIGQLAVHTPKASDQLQQRQITAADGNPLVGVTVTASGALADPRAIPQIQRTVPCMVARGTINLVGQAKGEPTHPAQRIIPELAGSDPVAGQEVAARVGQRLRRTHPDGDGWWRI